MSPLQPVQSPSAPQQWRQWRQSCLPSLFCCTTAWRGRRCGRSPTRCWTSSSWPLVSHYPRFKDRNLATFWPTWKSLTNLELGYGGPGSAGLWAKLCTPTLSWTQGKRCFNPWPFAGNRCWVPQRNCQLAQPCWDQKEARTSVIKATLLEQEDVGQKSWVRISAPVKFFTFGISVKYYLRNLRSIKMQISFVSCNVNKDFCVTCAGNVTGFQ